MNSPRGILRKQNVVFMDEKNNSKLSLWKNQKERRSGLLSFLSCSLPKRMAKITSFKYIPKKENELQSLYACLCKTWEAKKDFVYRLSIGICSSASFGLRQAFVSCLALPTLSFTEA